MIVSVVIGQLEFIWGWSIVHLGFWIEGWLVREQLPCGKWWFLSFVDCRSWSWLANLQRSWSWMGNCIVLEGNHCIDKPLICCEWTCFLFRSISSSNDGFVRYECSGVYDHIRDSLRINSQKWWGSKWMHGYICVEPEMGWDSCDWIELRRWGWWRWMSGSVWSGLTGSWSMHLFCFEPFDALVASEFER